MTSLTILRRCLSDTRGASAIEYALIAALLAGAIIAAVGGAGQSVLGLYTRTTAAVQAAIPGSVPP